MSNVWRGSTLVEAAGRETFSRNAGYRSYKVFKGTETEITNLYLQYTSLGSTCEVQKGPVWTLTVDIQGEDPVFQYEILLEPKVIDILDTDAFKVVTNKNVFLINYTADNVSASLDTGTGQIAYPDFDGDATQEALATKALTLKLHGFSEMTLFVPVMRVSYVVSSDYQVPNSVTNIDVVHSTDTMINVENIPIGIWGALQDSYTTTVASTIYNNQTVNLVYNYGWLKRPPQVTYQSNNRIQVTQEYQFAAWVVDVYGSMI